MSKNDSYSQRRWKQIQNLADQFWRKWSKVYLLNLQKRKKWTRKNRNVVNGDVVLMVDMISPRCQWVMGVIANVKPSRAGWYQPIILIG